MNYTIVEARRTHILPVAAAIEAAEGDDVAAMGMTVRQALRTAFSASAYRRAAVVADRPVALWGAIGSLLDDDVEVWAAFAPAARVRPVVMVREAVAELGTLLTTCGTLRSSMLCHDARALRFAQFLGFKVDEQVQIAGSPFFKATLRRA